MWSHTQRTHFLACYLWVTPYGIPSGSSGTSWYLPNYFPSIGWITMGWQAKVDVIISYGHGCSRSAPCDCLWILKKYRVEVMRRHYVGIHQDIENRTVPSKNEGTVMTESTYLYRMCLYAPPWLCMNANSCGELKSVQDDIPGSIP